MITKGFKTLICCVLLFATWQCIQRTDVRTAIEETTADIVHKPEDCIEEPWYDTRNSLYVKRMAYSLKYNKDYKQAEWVAYALKRRHLVANFKRGNQFTKDPDFHAIVATDKDYKGCGFDRGHLVPASDMTWSKQALDESFYYTNVSPQLPSFNRGIWKQLENWVRKWAKLHDQIYITVGTVCKDTNSVIGSNRVVVPTSFYKTILVVNDSVMQGIGFVFPHAKCGNDLFDYAISIDSVEAITGLNFYHRLPAKIQEQIEKSVNKNFWTN